MHVDATREKLQKNRKKTLDNFGVDDQIGGMGEELNPTQDGGNGWMAESLVQRKISLDRSHSFNL